MARVTGVPATRPADQPGEGGSTPTVTLFRRADWWVQDVPLATARRLVQAYHYAAGASNTAVACHGLFPRGLEGWDAACAGVAWWLPPTRVAAERLTLEHWGGVLSLSRLVLAPEVPPNGASFLIRHSMRLLDRKRWPVLVTFADEWRGHTGAIYELCGWTPDRYTTPSPTYVRGGRLVARKAGPKTRTHAEMLALGCECVGRFRKRRFVHRAS